ncbi:CDP-diacylglycerol--glycerol-3-phosphate 3-phosphatidyltransferase [Thioalkalivibrio sp. HK1]|uniref:CDP-diacylglycerol--glycerol-3-phosphate 3-phosphatidyltransferase n=1 Tax=Thioalkalivibrio sp. HK1 TaxID=1469245 RepID=UPI0004B8311F|nr:CDP-diacylglycerol--glycerol-3-phosphate 3-phosphatidyltransferase [Thioalkalivibrio sp. HK1]
MNLPNLLTALRIALIPVLVIVFYLPLTWSPSACAAIFALAAITDWADGFLARRLGQVSSFGAFLDPVADKLMVAVTLVLLVQNDPRSLIAIPAAIIIGREIVVSALRELMAELGERTTVAVASIGKVKTAVQMIALLLMLYRYDYGSLPVYGLGLVLLYVAVGLTLWSMFVYLQAAWSVIRDKEGADSKDPDNPSGR